MEYVKNVNLKNNLNQIKFYAKYLKAPHIIKYVNYMRGDLFETQCYFF